MSDLVSSHVDRLESRASFGPSSTCAVANAALADGYRGIWFALGFTFEYGDKYSGGLGTYTANHVPMAEYAPAVGKTFFTYGGTPAADRRELAIMVSFYDHERGVVPRPVTLYLDPAVNDPHDNASLSIDADGHVWVFKSGRNFSRRAFFFRSVKPYDISVFERVADQEVTYPQVWRGRDGGWFLFFTKYFGGTEHGPERKLFWKTSADGRTWSDDHLLAGFGGHYQTSGRHGPVVATFFNWHPNSDNDRRTNLYYAQTADEGKTWTTAAGAAIDVPLTHHDNAALVLDLQAEGKFMFTCDLTFDGRGRPVLLCIISRAGEPGPAGDPREWTVLHWTGAEWRRHVVTVSDHNYDMGSLYVEEGLWRVIGPMGAAPQRWGAGGEMESWVSRDEGRTWTKERALTGNSENNHSYARRPLNAHPGFAVFWADGNPRAMTKSHLYFANADGSRVFRLPYDMNEDFARPEAIGGTHR